MENRERTIRIIGGGPAGAAAAIAARGFGAEVRILEKSSTPRHKVCGEFISAEACEAIRELGAWDAFLDLKPGRSTRCCLHFGARVKQWSLPEAAFGLSRLALDRLLLQKAAESGASIVRGERWRMEQRQPGAALILASGRMGKGSKGRRLFAFKSHFDGPVDDAVELFFGAAGYVGVSAVEGGITNVCGMAPETELQRYGFHYDDFLWSRADLRERLRPLTRRMPWLSTGPLEFGPPAAERIGGVVYRAGDALRFIDPFTGSGILNALSTGRMAGQSAARGLRSAAYMQACRQMMHRPFTISAILRKLLDWGCAAWLAPLVPGDWLYSLTRIASPGNALSRSAAFDRV